MIILLNWQELKKIHWNLWRWFGFVFLVHLILVKKLFYLSIRFILLSILYVCYFHSAFSAYFIFALTLFLLLARNDNNEKSFFCLCTYFVNCCLCFCICVYVLTNHNIRWILSKSVKSVEKWLNHTVEQSFQLEYSLKRTWKPQGKTKEYWNINISYVRISKKKLGWTK